MNKRERRVDRRETELTPARYAQMAREREELRRGYKHLFIRIAVLAGIGVILFSFVFLVTQAVGNDMFPAVKDGDLVIGYRLQREYSKDDVVIYTVDGKTHIGRVAARATDEVTLDDSGTLLVNGVAQGGEILYPTYAKEGIEYPYTVPENCIFVLGDYRTQTEDSRDFGAIPLKNVKGKVITILRRRGL